MMLLSILSKATICVYKAKSNADIYQANRYDEKYWPFFGPLGYIESICIWKRGKNGCEETLR